MFTVTEKAAEKLKQQFLHKCFETSIGFRLSATPGSPDMAAFNIRLDRQYENDTVIDLNDLKLLLDPSTVAHIRDYQLDWMEGADTGFFLKTDTREQDEKANSSSQINSE